MKQLYEHEDAVRILAQAIHEAGGIAEFCDPLGVSDNEDTLKNERVLKVLNLRRVEAFDRIES